MRSIAGMMLLLATLSALPGYAQKVRVDADTPARPASFQAAVTASDAGDYFHRQRKIYRWSDQTKFVLVHISAPQHLPDWRPENVEAVKAAFAQWQQAMGNRVMFVFMNDTANVDVTIHWWNTVSTNVEKGACGLNKTETWGKYISKNDVFISLHGEDGAPWSPDQVYSTALHEIGHMLGIKEHSDNPNDVMAAASATTQLTARDINTMKRIYARKADYTNPPGYHLSHFEAFKQTQKGNGIWIPIMIPVAF